MFKITNGKGFHMTFKNGLTLSVQFGKGNYCKNYSIPWEKEREQGLTCEDAEIAVWDRADAWITKEFVDDAKESDGVAGHISVEELAGVIAKIMEYKGAE
jgi:hypothetical protein